MHKLVSKVICALLIFKQELWKTQETKHIQTKDKEEKNATKAFQFFPNLGRMTPPFLSGSFQSHLHLTTLPLHTSLQLKGQASLTSIVDLQQEVTSRLLLQLKGLKSFWRFADDWAMTLQRIPKVALVVWILPTSANIVLNNIHLVSFIVKIAIAVFTLQMTTKRWDEASLSVMQLWFPHHVCSSNDGIHQCFSCRYLVFCDALVNNMLFNHCVLDKVHILFPLYSIPLPNLPCMLMLCLCFIVTLLLLCDNHLENRYYIDYWSIINMLTF